jgi:aspartyl-tRNA(Asn)/glutamyl-tRNA(Gln) amidotransferase subunit A
MAEITDDVFFASITELSAKLRAKEFSCVELTRAFCERFERLAPRYNALALSLREQAIRQARDVDDELKRDRTRGPLQGIPYGAKDLLAVKGHPTTWGARPFAGQVFNEDARVIERLNGSRAILIGKLSMVELAGGGNYRFPSASLQGPGRNPWNRERWSGGSSSGSGAAVAAGLVTFALGSETSGSILTPSAFSGVTGLRPTYGLVSRRGAMALSWTLDKIGPMCRSAEDCALVLHDIAGTDRLDPGNAGKSFTYAPQFQRDPKEITIGYAPADFSEWPEPETRPAFQAALEVIRSLGYRLKEVQLPNFPYGALVSTILAGEAGSIFEDFIRSGRVDQLADQRQIAGLKSYVDLPATDYLRAMRVRSLVQAAFYNLFIDLSVNVLLSPTRYETAPGINDPLDQGGRSGPPPSSPGLNGLIPAGNLTGLPALSLPCGFAGGLPVAISLVGRPFYENQLIGIGNGFQKQTDWHRRRPPAA